MHNIKLRWIRDEDPEEHSTENWQVFWNGSFVQVAGACPRCGAGDQTEYTSIDDGDLGTFADELPPPFNVPNVPRRRIRKPPPEVVLRMRCRCGEGVHAKDKDGCGATWKVRVRR